MQKLTNLWKMHEWTMGKIFDGFSAEDFAERVHGLNPANWIIGHMTGSRKHLGNWLGMEFEFTDADKPFDMGAKPDDMPNDVDGETLLAEFMRVNEAFMKHLESLTPEDLEHKIENEFPLQPKTREGALQFMYFHEAYHLGQLSAIRVQLGKGSWR